MGPWDRKPQRYAKLNELYAWHHTHPSETKSGCERKHPIPIRVSSVVFPFECATRHKSGGNLLGKIEPMNRKAYKDGDHGRGSN